VSLNRGGCETFLLRFIPRFNNYDHRILTLKKKGDLADDFKKNNIKVDSLDKCPLLLKPYQSFRYVKRYEPDMIVTYLSLADFWGRFFFAPFLTCRVVPFLRTTYNYPRYKVVRLLERLTSFLVKTYLANSNSVKDYYCQRLGVPDKKIFVLENGLDLSIFRKNQDRIVLRRELKIPMEDFVICCVGSLNTNKGQMYLLKAFKKLYKRDKKMWLLFAGDGDRRLVLEEEIKDFDGRNQVKLLGKRDDVPKVLAGSDIFVLPTLFEGMSNALLEAMVAMLPIVTTDIEENKALIKHGNSGLLVPVASIDPLVKSIWSLRTEEEFGKFLAMNAYDFVKKNYGIAMVVKRAEKLFGRIIA
jgi:glycosyltransferase involved in cell wall biosynthesis